MRAVGLSCILMGISFSALYSQAQAAIDDSAAVVLLRKSCTENQTAMDNCFTTLGSLNSWMHQTRLPSATNPLMVDVGPGTFPGAFQCTNLGYITVRGSGRDNTTLDSSGGFSPGMVLDNCDQLNVSDIRILGSYGGVAWSGAGRTTWTNVEVIGAGRGWYETLSFGNCNKDNTKHYWFSSKIVAEPLFTLVIPYNAACGESWFYGSELLAYGENTRNLSPSSNNTWGTMTPIAVFANTEAHVYGSVLRAIAPAAGSSGSVARAATVDSGELHIHGTGIDVLSSIDVPIEALRVSNGGALHANESAYNLSTTAGQSVTRLVNNGGSISAPFQWKQDTVPPAIQSVDGADSVVETDCATTGCQSSGVEPHLLIYSSACTTDGPWFDVVTGKCRGL